MEVALFRDLKNAFWLPAASWLIADTAIGALAVMQYGFSEGLKYAIYPGQLFIYAALAMVCVCGLLIRRSRNWSTIFGSGLLGVCLFFLISNFAAWAFNIETYTKDLNGLLTCYAAGLPFFRNHVISTVLFSGILFSPIGIRYLESHSTPVPTEDFVPVVTPSR